jgi:hypothetical protein
VGKGLREESSRLVIPLVINEQLVVGEEGVEFLAVILELNGTSMNSLKLLPITQLTSYQTQKQETVILRKLAEKHSLEIIIHIHCVVMVSASCDRRCQLVHRVRYRSHRFEAAKKNR